MRIVRSIPGSTIYTPSSQLGGLGETPLPPAQTGVIDSIVGFENKVENFISINPRIALGIMLALVLRK